MHLCCSNSSRANTFFGVFPFLLFRILNVLFWMGILFRHRTNLFGKSIPKRNLCHSIYQVLVDSYFSVGGCWPMERQFNKAELMMVNIYKYQD